MTGKKTQERVRKLRKKLPLPEKCSKCGKEIVLESPDAKPFTIKGEPVCKDCWCKEMGEEMEKHPIMLPEKLRKPEEEISVVVQSPTMKKEVNDMDKKTMEEKAKKFNELVQKIRINKELEKRGLKPKGRDYLREFAEREARPCHSCPPKVRSKCNIDSYRACPKRLHPQTEDSSL